MKNKLILMIAFFSFATSFAQNANIKGKITENVSGKLVPVPFANVVISGTSIGTTSDLEGGFSIPVEAGNYDLIVSFIGYVNDTIKNISVAAGETKNVSSLIKQNVQQLEEVNIVAEKTTHTEAAVLMEMKKSEQVVNGISSEQIAKSQDRNASDIIRRIPGVTIIENRFVMVRGLSERYNSVLLNDALTPSSEADKKAFSFDIIPTGAIDRLLIYKTGAPELPGEFAGGVIKIFTKSIPDSNFISVGYASSYRNGTTFNPFFTSGKNSADVLGFGGNSRELPDNFPAVLDDAKEPQQLANAGKSLPNSWATEESNAMPDLRLNFAIAKKFRIGKISAGNITSVSYSNTNEHFEAKNYNYNAFDLEKQKSDTIYNYTDNNYNNTVRLGILHNWSFLLTPNHKLEIRSLFNNSGSNQSTLRTGKNFEEGFEVKNYSFRYQQRYILSNQLKGDHSFNNENTRLFWTIAQAISQSKEPDLRRIRTVRDINSSDSVLPYQVIIAPAASTLDAGRFFSELDESVITASSDFNHKFLLFSGMLEPKIKAGFYAEKKERFFSARWMSYKRAHNSKFNSDLLTLPMNEIFASENINDTTGFKLAEGTNPSDKYNAANLLLAAYSGVSIPYGNINFSLGARAEYNRQQLFSRSYTNKKITVDNPVLSILPSLNVSYNFTEKSLVRGAYSKTVNRPEFRELAPFAYYDFNFNNVLYGNDSLKIANIDNYDLRYEFYPSPSEIVSFGVFYKKFTNPIEMFFVPGSGSGGTRNFTFKNADFATSAGAEIEIRKTLAFCGKLLENFSLLFNTAYIQSKIALGENAVGQSKNRPMMGQSPYSVNTGIYYNNSDNQLQFNVLYNIIGKRLFAVGTFGTPDVYEMPRNVIDITISKRLGKYFEVKGGVQDILNQHTLLIQDSNENGSIDSHDQELMTFKRGAVFTLGINCRF